MCISCYALIRYVSKQNNKPVKDKGACDLVGRAIEHKIKRSWVRFTLLVMYDGVRHNTPHATSGYPAIMDT